MLVVEDCDDDAALIRLAFERSGFSNPLQTVGYPDEALRYLKGEGQYGDRGKFPFPALVILDHKLPGDGWEVLQWVRQQPELAALPVVIFSGSEDPNHEQKACALGATAYRIKPQRLDEFIESVKRLGEQWLDRH